MAWIEARLKESEPLSAESTAPLFVERRLSGQGKRGNPGILSSFPCAIAKSQFQGCSGEPLSPPVGPSIMEAEVLLQQALPRTRLTRRRFVQACCLSALCLSVALSVLHSPKNATRSTHKGTSAPG